MKIDFRFFYIIILCYFVESCVPGDGSTLNPFGEPLGPPKLVVNPLEIDITLQKGNSLSLPVKLKNVGGFPLEITEVSSESDWIELQDSTFPLSLETADSVQISVNIGEASLQAGSFQGTVIIISNDSDVENSEFSLSIKLEITEEILAFEPTLSKIQSKIFSFVCTECHDSSNPPEGLNLTRGNSYVNLVNKKSNQVPELFLVEPFNPDDSYLIRKMEGGPDIVEDRMPRDQAPISQDHINVVRVWISQGAQDN